MKYYPLSISCALVIAILSVMNMGSVPSEILSLGDKALHSIAYGGWSFIILFEAVWNRETLTRIQIWALSVGLTGFFGGGMELVQAYLFPPRQGDWLDLIADLLGSFVITVLFVVCLPQIKKGIAAIKKKTNGC